jgi:hypothetical protein
VETLVSNEKIKCYEITPSGDPRFDYIIVEAGDSWQPALEQAEDALEAQFLKDVSWDEIRVNVKCVYKTREELNEMES